MANVVQLVIKGIDQTGDAITRPIKGFQDLGTALDRLKPAFLAAGAAAAGAFALMARSAINTADATAKAAQKVGLTTEALSTLRHAADLSGVSAEGLQTGLIKLAKGMADAQLGIGDARLALDAMGISATNTDGSLRSTDAVMADVAKQFRGMEDGAGKTALAVRLFGKSGADLIPLLNAGADGIREMQDEARALGLEISGPTGKAAEGFNDNLSRLRAAVMGVVNGVVAEFLPSLAKLASEAVALVKDFGLVEAATGAMIDAFRLGKFFAEALATGFKGLYQAIKLVADLIGSFAAAATKAFELVGAAMGRTLAGIWEMLKGNFSLGRSILDDALKGVRSDFAEFQQASKVIADQVIEDWEEVWDTFGKGPIAPVLGQGRTPAAPQAPPAPEDEKRPAPSMDPSASFIGPTLPAGYRMPKESKKAEGEGDFLRQQEEEVRRLTELQEFRDELAIRQLENLAALDEKGLLTFEAERARAEQQFQETLQWIGDRTTSEEEFYAHAESAWALHQQNLTLIQKSEEDKRRAIREKALDGAQAFFAQGAALAKSFGKKGHAVYKAFAISEAIISTYKGAARALADYPTPYNYVVAAAVVAAGLANVATIRSSEPQGVAHGGMDFVPGEATYLLQRGERVIQPSANRDLIQFLEDQQGARGGPIQVTVYLDGRAILEHIEAASNDGRLTINALAVS